MAWSPSTIPAQSSSARRNIFSCSSLDDSVLLAPGKQPLGGNGLISNGCTITVADGQCALLVSRGKVFDLCAQAGTYSYQGGVPEPLPGELGEAALKHLYPYPPDSGGHRLYYVSIRPAKPIFFENERSLPFPITIPEDRLDLDISLFCRGSFRYRVCDPALFFTNVTGNAEEDFREEAISGLLRDMANSALPAALMHLAAEGKRFPSQTAMGEAAAARMAESLAPQWRERMGLELTELSFSEIRPEEAAERFFHRWLSTAPAESGKADAWYCPDCGARSTGNFCPQCGKKRPD